MAGKPSMIQLLILQLIGCLGWLSGIALAQLEFSEVMTGSVNISDIGITCLANAAVFVTSMLRGRLYLEMGARDVMATITGQAELKKIDDRSFRVTTCVSDREYDGQAKLKKIEETFVGLTTCGNYRKYADVVMLTEHPHNSSIRQFMKYIKNTHALQSILVKCSPLRSENSIDEQIVRRQCPSELMTHNCNCIVFSTDIYITKMLVLRMPGKLKELDGSHCLLPCQQCLAKDCHGCKDGMSFWEDSNTLTERNAILEPPAAVSEVLHYRYTTDSHNRHICICIPLHPRIHDHWTHVLMKSLKFKDQEDRGAIVMASVALENYLSMETGKKNEDVFYSTTSLIVPRLVEIFINIVLTLWLKLDGFSSSMVARKAVRNYVVNSTGNGLAANVCLNSALVTSYADNTSASNVDDPNNTSVCQVLSFRGGTLLSPETLSFIVPGVVNLICSITWAALIAFGKSTGKWYEMHSIPPSKPIIAAIMAAICIALVMDFLEWTKTNRRLSRRLTEMSRKKSFMLGAVMILEMACMLSGTTVAGALGIKGFGRWVYSALQGLVWVKWGMGCYLLGEYSPEYEVKYALTDSDTRSIDLIYSNGRWVDQGTMVYSSAFLLNSVLAAVRGWKK